MTKKISNADRQTYENLHSLQNLWYGIMDFLVALCFILAAAAIIFWITKPR